MSNENAKLRKKDIIHKKVPAKEQIPGHILVRLLDVTKYSCVVIKQLNLVAYNSYFQRNIFTEKLLLSQNFRIFANIKATSKSPVYGN